MRQLAVVFGFHFAILHHAAFFHQALGQKISDHHAKQRRHNARSHHRGERNIKSIGRGNGIRVGRHNIARLAAAHHRQQNRRFRQTAALGQRQRNRCHGDHRHIHKHAHGGEYHGGERERQQRAGFAELFHNGFGNHRGRARFNQHTGQHAGGQNAHHGGGDALRTAYHQAHGFAQTRAAH